MRLIKARVQNYRSILDTGEFEVENLKTILVGPNEAGKTVLLQALQQLKKPDDISGFDPLRDYPRSKYNDITTGKAKPEQITVVTGYFDLEDEDKELIPEDFHQCQYKLYRNLNNKGYHSLINAPDKLKYADIKKSLIRMASHMDTNFPATEGGKNPSEALSELCSAWIDTKSIEGDAITSLEKWLNDHYKYVAEDNETEEQRHTELLEKVKTNRKHDEVLKILDKRTPVFILFNNYFKVKPTIHLGHLAQRIEQNILDDEYYDYGNQCLLKLLGFSARELSNLGNTPSPNANDADALKNYKDKLDSRSYQLNAASVRLTNEIRQVWMPNPDRPEADKLKVTADGQYLKVVVEDDLGVDIELDQRSEGFQWLVSFFIVFFSEAMDKHENAILLLDEPGMSLHALKQRDFRETISRLAKKNQTLFTTHSPFLVGPDELDIVRVVEMKNRVTGTKVHTTISSEDPAGLLPLQEALGYDLAHSLFSQQRNLILEGITDYWYIEATSELLRAASESNINNKIALVFANTAGKVVYYATILHAHNLKVAALLDSDSAGDQAAQQEALVHTLGNKNILRTKDYCSIQKAEIEDLLRETLIKIAKDTFGVDVSKQAAKQAERPIVSIFANEIDQFSKYKLAKAYVRWTRTNESSALTDVERGQWKSLFESINRALK
ncbi:AAA family ATPase [Shewanella xiamenensis]|uniref:AAA family ATPase n=1 Tax=Shewanella xiamenensis TaxID=332186 RepID=UPI003F1C12A1